MTHTSPEEAVSDSGGGTMPRLTEPPTDAGPPSRVRSGTSSTRTTAPSRALTSTNLELPHERPAGGNARTHTRDLTLDLWAEHGGSV